MTVSDRLRMPSLWAGPLGAALGRVSGYDVGLALSQRMSNWRTKNEYQ